MSDKAVGWILVREFKGVAEIIGTSIHKSKRSVEEHANDMNALTSSGAVYFAAAVTAKREIVQ